MGKKENNTEYGKTGTGDKWIHTRQREAKAGEGQEMVKEGGTGIVKAMSRTVRRTGREQDKIKQNWDKKLEKQRLRLKNTRHMIQTSACKILARSRNGLVWTTAFSYAASSTHIQNFLCDMNITINIAT